MAESKEERENRFIQDWNSGMTEKNLAKKYKMSIGAVKSWKSYIRAHDLPLYKGKLRKTRVARERIFAELEADKKRLIKKKRKNKR